MKSLGAAISATAGLILAANAAHARPVPNDPPPTILPNCSLNDVSFLGIKAVDCRGYFSKNILSGNAGDLTTQQTALAQMGLTWPKTNWPAVDASKDNNGNQLGEFGPMFGTTYIGIHYGRGNGPVDVEGGVTAIYKLVFGTETTSFNISPGSVSSVALYSTESPGDMELVPEPATWAMLIAGFGVVGAAMRRRRGLASVNA